MHEALERRETHDRAPRPPDFEPDHAAAEIEDHERGQHAEDCDSSDPAQRNVSEFAPFTTRRLFENSGALIGDADAPLDSVQFLQELLLLHRTGRRVNLLGAGRSRHGDNQQEGRRADGQADQSCKRRHELLPSIYARDLQDSIVSR